MERGAHQVQYCPVYPAPGEGGTPGTVLSSPVYPAPGEGGTPGTVFSSVSCTWRGEPTMYSIVQCILPAGLLGSPGTVLPSVS